MDSSGDRMPLPDADKRSPRVYTNLQNLDLSTVTFSNIETTGDPIAIEEANEDELRRLVLVNLARLVCAGEWNGLLTAGASSEFNAEISKYDWDGDEDAVRVMALPPYGCLKRSLDLPSMQDDEIVLYPFIAPTTGTVSQVDLYVGTTDSGTTGAIDVGFYSDNDGIPETFLGEFVLATTSSGQVTQTTSSADVETVRGTQYWLGLYADNFDVQPKFMLIDRDGSGSAPGCGEQYGSVAIPTGIFKASAGGNATITDITTFSPSGAMNPINVGVKW